MTAVGKCPQCHAECLACVRQIAEGRPANAHLCFSCSRQDAPLVTPENYAAVLAQVRARRIARQTTDEPDW